MEMTDLATVSRARGGDSEAFRLLVERHSRPVFKVAYRMTGNEHDADDVVQETFLRAYRQIDRFQERANFGTWLHRIAINCALDLLRARGRHDKHYIHESEDGEMSRSFEASDPQPDRLLLSAEVQQHVAKALERLSGNERTAFMLRHFEGMPVEEIGKTLGIQVNAAKHTIFRAVRKLRESLEPLVRPNTCNT
ncbi:MAG: sigma-70 family RNA polymerase sigma factor [Thermoanaerobaculia bacterium]|nr:sigma-70 family RNA polymerase sigma factor [Thermoanaerobaculia bacterium]